MAFELTIAEGKGRGQRFQFEAADVTIGRGSENDVVLNDPGVSRNHARIRQAGSGHQLLDNGSANGTELNGAVILKPTQLRDGDRIGVGPITFRYENEQPEAITPLPPVESSGEDATRITGVPQSGASTPRNEETRVSSMPLPGAPARAVTLKAGGSLVAPQTLSAWFIALPPKVRAGLLGAGALLLLAIVVAWAREQKPQGVICPEVVAMDDDTADTSFGHGVVDVDCGAKAAFGFTTPAKTKVFFHYEASHVATPSELELKLNGKHLAWAPVAGSRGEAQIVPLPDDLLSSDGRNIVTFAQAQKAKEWAVDKVRIEFFAITPGDLKAAQTAYELGRRKFEERRVAPRNLYDAWKYFTAARRSLEGVTPRPPLYDEVAQLIKDTEKELDKECSRIIFSAQRQEKYGQDDKAQQSYREVLSHFPGEDPTGCRKKAQANIVASPSAN